MFIKKERMLENQFDLTTRQPVGEEQVDVGIKDFQPTTTVTNVYVGKRNFIHQLMDVALLMANVSQLKALLSLPSSDRYYYPLFVFISLSISLQVTFTVCMLVIWSTEKKLEDHLTDTEHEYPEDEAKKRRAEHLDKFCNILVLLIIVSNIFIAGFGIEAHDPPPSDNAQVQNGSAVK